MGYENAKVYKLQCADGHFYIGSTKENLPHRRAHHVAASKKFPERRVYNHINGDWENVRIILIEECPCENREQLRRKEDEHIQRELKNQLCLNNMRAFNPRIVKGYYFPRGPLVTGTEEEQNILKHENNNEAAKRYYLKNIEKQKESARERARANATEVNARKRELRKLKCEAEGREYVPRVRKNSNQKQNDY